MDNTILEIISAIEYIFHKKKDEVPIFLKKKIKCNVEYISDLDIIIIPRTFYIFTDNISEDNRHKILIFYIRLLHNIHEKIGKMIIPIIEHQNIGMVETTKTKSISLIQGDSSITLDTEYNYIISIISDNNDNSIKPENYGYINDISDSNICRIIIGDGKRILNNIKPELSVFLYLNNNI